MIGDFLKPPTDNLYKFMCICGLILVIVSVTYPPWQLNKLMHSYYENMRDYEILDVDVKQSERKSEQLEREADKLGKERDALLEEVTQLDKTIRDLSHLSSKEKVALKADLDRLQNAQAQLEDKDRRWSEKAAAYTDELAAQRKKNIDLKYKAEAAIWDSRSGKVLTILALFTAVAGVFLGTKGFNLWSLRVQVYQDAILKNQAESVEPEEVKPDS